MVGSVNTPQVTECAARVRALFAGREGVFAQQMPSGSYNPVRPDRDITLQDIVEHLRGARSYAVYPVLRDNTCRFICFDVDVTKAELQARGQELQELRMQLLPTLRALQDSVLSLQVEPSCVLIEDTGGRGFHLWVFFEIPVQAAFALRLAEVVLDRANVRCEVFPKQASVRPDGYGNPIKLPLGIHRRYGRASQFLDLVDDGFAPAANPLACLAAVAPIPSQHVAHLIREFGSTQVRISVAQPDHIILSPPSSLASDCGLIFTRCAAMARLRERLAAGAEVDHDSLLALGALLANVESGEELLHKLLQNWPRYNTSITSRMFQSLVARGLRPPSCTWLVEHGVCDGYCSDDVVAGVLKGRLASPIRFGTWRDEATFDALLRDDDLRFERVYARQNLHRAWQQVLRYVREEDVVWDQYQFDSFRANLDCNIECLREELITKEYRPQPYRVVRVPKAVTSQGFEYREKVLLHPRDHIAAQAVLNIVGPVFEPDFSDASLGRRLELREGAGVNVFRPWQVDWQRNKRRILSFQYHPSGYHYIRADITRFFDQMDHTLLIGRLSEKLSGEPGIIGLIRFFLSNAYLDDANGRERLSGPRRKGVPQGPALSAFLANLYLDPVDKYMRGRCVDYVRYVDDIAFVARTRDEALGLKDELARSLAESTLQLHPTKTQAPRPVSDAKGLRDFLGEMKYGAAGLLSRPTAWRQKPMPQLWELAESLKGIDPLDVNRLDEMGRNLRFYLEFRKVLTGGRHDETALRLALEAVRKCALRPRDLLTCIQIALIRFGGSAQEIRRDVLDRLPHHYGRVVLAQALGWEQEGVAEDAATEVLRELATGDSSYLVRGVAAASLDLRKRPISEDNPTAFLAREESPYVKARAIATLRHALGDSRIDALSIAFQDEEPNLSVAAAEVTLQINDGRLLSNLVSAWLRSPRSRQLLPLITRAGLEAATRDGARLLERSFAYISPALVSSLLRLTLGRMDDVFRQRPDGQIHFLALIDMQAMIADQALSAILARELQLQLPLEAEVQRPSKTAVYAARQRLDDSLARAAPQTALPVLFSEYADHQPLHHVPGHVNYYLATHRASGANVVIERVPKEILAEFDWLDSANKWGNLTDVIVAADLSFSIRSWEDDESRWTAYEIPLGWRMLADLVSSGTTYGLDEVLAMTDALFAKLCELRQLGAPVPIVGPFGIVVGPGNELRLVSLLGGLPVPRYVSRVGAALEDISHTNVSNFAGMLSFELLTGSCPVAEIAANQSYGDERVSKFSASEKLDSYPQHYAWILDRLTRPGPHGGYKTYDAFAEDYHHFRRFRDYCRGNLDRQPDVEIHSLETLDVLALRIGREIAARLAEGESYHVILLALFHAVCDRLRRAEQAASKKGIRWEPVWLARSSGIGVPWVIRRWAHVSSGLCLRLASGLSRAHTLVSRWSGWTIPRSASCIVGFLSLRVEAVALLRQAIAATASSYGRDSAAKLQRQLAQDLWAVAATGSDQVGIRAGGVTGPSTGADIVIRWGQGVWAGTADILAEVADKADPSVIEDRGLVPLIAATGLLLGHICLTEVQSGAVIGVESRTFSCRCTGITKAWAQLLEASYEAEELIYRIFGGWEQCDQADERAVICAVIACLSSLRRVRVGRRLHAHIAERFKPIGVPLKIRQGFLGTVFEAKPDTILSFPAHTLESFPGEPVSADLVDRSRRLPSTVAVVPSDLHDWLEVGHHLRRCWREVTGIARQRISWFIVAWIVTAVIMAWGYVTGWPILYLLGIPEGVLSGILATWLYELCKERR